MATTRTRGTWRKAALTPDSPDAEAKAMATTPELMTTLDAARKQARQPGGTVTQQELDRRRPISPEAEREADALLSEWEAEDGAHR